MTNSDFQTILKDKLPEGICLSDVQYSKSGCALFYQDGKPVVLGCPLCVNPIKGQNKNGVPTLNGQDMKPGEESTEVPLNTPPEIMANLWLCPRCERLDSSFLPTYITKWMNPL